ncbi:MAG: citrate synthase [Candidatus Omnitrophica bacterium]|nr:citrate synthase [Candidatus Omnitrophota bacterium]
MPEIFQKIGEAELRLGSQKTVFPVYEGIEKERGIDISTLREQTGHITLDHGFSNTGACTSAITYIDGEKGVLRYRGIPIEELAEQSTFVETAYLLIFGKLPNPKELDGLSRQLTKNASLHEDIEHFFEGFPSATHPMAILCSVVSALSGYYPAALNFKQDEAQITSTAVQLISKVRTIAAYSYKKSVGEPFIYPKRGLKYCENFLHMMFSYPSEEYEIDPDVVRALELALILHADHEQNCSTSTVRLAGSSRTNLFASVAAGICALWGPWHGGANQDVMQMLEGIHESGETIEQYIEEAIDPNNPKRLAGFGHRVYKTYDPRAKILKEAFHRLVKKGAQGGGNEALLDIALKLEEKALTEDFFISRKLYPNVDFYSGLIYNAIGIPTAMFPVMFAIGRLPGWIAHWKEMREFKPPRIGRPRQIYTGPAKQSYVPMDQR